MIGKLKLARRNRGQTLVEVVVAFGLIGISLAAMMSLTVATKNLLYNSSDITKANTLAEEGIEIARHQRDIGCSFSSISSSVASGTTNFVIKGDTESTNDETIQTTGTPNKISNFDNFSRNITIQNLSDAPASVLQDGSGNPYFQTGSDCGTDNDYDCTDKYYYITVTVTGPNNDVTTSASTIMSKQ